ncbi:hypothetical protein Q4Q39_05605 [Flavivirga amylovorans]|uniref:Toxin-antitoxin system YwqK family antitoxin n=1 Tax=Flavivirga amylovorans TaxID=870486 RepID=A0ABT8WYY2_9FLAO|nr:toxin-antitoxin system YwqK family antitoxin [Flavivirga amylovorans]MDO5986878.1 hypothetical protein [Flavivirga amylovorans]
MKIKYLLLLLVVLTSCKDDISNEKFRNENYVFYQENGKDGKWLKINPELEIKLPKSHSTYFFPNGKRYVELEVIDSFPNRILKFYNKEDKLIRTSKFKSDSVLKTVYENGYYRGYHSNIGLLKSEGLIENGMYQGEWKFYRKDGETLKQIIGYVNDKYHGTRMDFWENGKKRDSTSYINGKLMGKAVHYYENGALEEINFLNDNKAHGKSIRYYPNGKLQAECTYWNGKKMDTCKFYYENGILKAIDIIELDTVSLSSTWITHRYLENGKLEKILEMKNEEPNGKAKLFHKNGKLAQEFNIKNNIKSGKVNVYYETGELQYTGFAKNNLLEGEIKHFDKSGKLIKTVIKENGIAIDSIMH